MENEVDESLFEMIPFGGATQEALDLVMQHAERHYLATHWNMLMKELENISVKQPLIHMLKVPCSASEEKVVQVSGKKWICLDTELQHMAEPEVSVVTIIPFFNNLHVGHVQLSRRCENTNLTILQLLFSTCSSC